MKSKLSLIFCLMVLCSTRVSAQFDPLSKEILESTWADIVSHDSIIYSLDTGAAYNVIGVVEFSLMPNGKYDTLNYFDMGNLAVAYDGRRFADSTVITGYLVSGGSRDTIEQYVFFFDQNGRDSLIDQSLDLGGGLAPFFRFELEYNPSNLPDKLNIMIDAFGSGSWNPYVEYQYYYTGSRVDSTVATNVLMSAVQSKTINSFNNNLMVASDMYYANSNGELELLEKYFFDHNAAGEITEVVLSSLDTNSGNWMVNLTWKYLTKSSAVFSQTENLQVSVGVYPNPVENELHISTPKGTFMNFEIYSLEGRLMQSGTFRELLNVKSLEPGQYFLRMTGDNGMLIKPFLKK